MNCFECLKKFKFFLGIENEFQDALLGNNKNC